jgi:putative inorganic carbon (HCO3(-)) transporter
MEMLNSLTRRRQARIDSPSENIDGMQVDSPNRAEVGSRSSWRIDQTRSPFALSFVGLYLFTLLLYLRPNDIFPAELGTFPLVKIVAVTTLVMYSVSKLMRKQPMTFWPIELKCLLIIMAIGVVLIPSAANRQDSIDKLTDSLEKVAIIFVLIINLVDTRARLIKMLDLLVVCGAVLALAAIHSYVVGEYLVKDKGVGVRIAGLVGGIFGNPNDLATALDMLLPFSVVQALTGRGLRRLFYLTVSAVMALAVVFTFSRGGFLGLVAVAGLTIWKLGRHNRAAILFGSFILLGVVLLSVPNGYGARLGSILHIENDATGSAQERQELLTKAFGVAVHHPIVGVGLGNFHIYSIHEKAAHNSYLETSAELGLAGLLAYLIIIFAPLRKLTALQRSIAKRGAGGSGLSLEDRGAYYLSVGLQATLVAYLVCSFFASIEYNWYLYYPAAFAIALFRIETSGSGEASQPTGGAGKGVVWSRHSGPRRRWPGAVPAGEPQRSKDVASSSNSRPGGELTGSCWGRWERAENE